MAVKFPGWFIISLKDSKTKLCSHYLNMSNINVENGRNLNDLRETFFLYNTNHVMTYGVSLNVFKSFVCIFGKVLVK